MQKLHKNLPIFLALIFNCFVANAAWAEDFDLKIRGEAISKLAALEVQLAFEPEQAYVLAGDFKVLGSFYDIAVNGTNLKTRVLETEVLYKYVDPSSSLLRVFFLNPVASSELVIKGKLERSNYSGDIKVTIKDQSFISDFAQEVNSENLKAEIFVDDSQENLPFIGISRAEVLGPKTRIKNGELVIAIGNIETYGFSLNQSIDSVKINGHKGTVVNEGIITSVIPVASIADLEELDLKLELEVDKRIIEKNLGSIALIDPI